MRVDTLLRENSDESFRKALDLLLQVKTANETNAEYWDWVSRCHLCLHNRNDADRAFKKFMILSMGRISFTPSNDFLLVEYPRMIERLGSVKDAEAILTRIFTNQSNYLPTVTALVKFYRRNNSPDKALKILEGSNLLKEERSLQIELAEILVDLNRNDDAMTILKETEKREKNNPTLHLNKGILYLSDKNYKKAIKEFKKVIELESMNTDSLFYQGMALFYMKDYEKAIDVLKHAITIDPSMISLWNNLAAAYIEIEEFKEAEEVFKYIIQNWPDEHHAYSNLAAVYTRSGMSHKSREWITKATEVALRKCNTLFYQKEYAKCISLCETVLKYNPKSADAYAIKAVVLLEKMEFMAAETLIEKAIELDPESSEALAAKSYFELTQSRLNRAERFSMEALELNENCTRAFLNLTIIHNQKGEFAESEKCIRKALNNFDHYSDGSIHLAQSLLGQRKISEAMNVLSDAIFEDPWNGSLWWNFAIVLETIGDDAKAKIARQRANELVPNIENGIASFKEHLEQGTW